MINSLILHEALPFHGGGPKSFLLLSRRLPRELYNYGSLTEAPDGLEAQLESAGAKVFCGRSKNRVVQVFRLLQYVRRNKIKAVFACSFRSYYLAKIVSSVVPLLVVFWIRDIAIMQTITKRFVFKVLSRKDWLIANSQAGLQAHSKPGRERTAVVYGGVEFPVICDKLHSRKAIGLPGDGFLLLYAADFKPYKDHATLIRAFKRLAPKWPTLYLGLCGRHGSLQKEVIDPILGESLGRDRVWLFGARRDIDALFSAADIYVHPCFVECFGNAVVEAMAAGLPVVVANGGGLAEVTGDSGILFEPRNDQELSDAINRLLESETERRIYSVKGKNRATQEFGADAYAVRFLRTAKTIFDREYREDG